MSGFNFSTFTNLSNVEISANGGFQKDVNRLECKPENGINGMYEFFGRFLPNPYDSSKSMISKSVVRLKNPAVSGESITFDCPKSIYKPSFFYTISSVLKKYEKEPGFAEVVKAISKSFSRWYSITSLMYISQDACHPENINKIKVFQYGAAINKIIEEAKAGTPAVPPCKPFDLLTGKDFHYLATIKSKALGFADYSSCNFLPQSTPFKYFMNGNYYDVTAEELNLMAQGQETLLVKLYEEQCPDMSRYEYNAPTQEQLMKAANYIRIIFAQYPTLLQEIINVTDDTEFVKMIQQQGGIIQPQAQSFGQPNATMQQPQQVVYGNQMQAGYQQPVQQPVQQMYQQGYVQAPSVNTFSGMQQAAPQSNLSEGGFIPKPQQSAQAAVDEEIQTFGGGSDRFMDAINNI